MRFVPLLLLTLLLLPALPGAAQVLPAPEPARAVLWFDLHPITHALPGETTPLVARVHGDIGCSGGSLPQPVTVTAQSGTSVGESDAAGERTLWRIEPEMVEVAWRPVGNRYVIDQDVTFRIVGEDAPASDVTHVVKLGFMGRGVDENACTTGVTYFGVSANTAVMMPSLAASGSGQTNSASAGLAPLALLGGLALAAAARRRLA